MSELLNHDSMKNLSIDDLLEANFDDVEEVVDFETYPKGVYVFDVKPVKQVDVERNVDGQKVKDKALEFTMIPQEVVECADDVAELAAKIVDNKQPLSVRYMAGFGIQDMTTRWKEVANHLGTASIGEFVQSVGGSVVKIEVRHRKAKNSDAVYPKLHTIVPV